ncbi:MAG: hypothetical protein H0U99_06595 [Chthoniobacterales bacterium]|nr:hypothetical protein [Chthoniobacterales bacterium]
MEAPGVEITRDILKAGGEELSPKEESRLLCQAVGLPPMSEREEQVFDRIEFLKTQPQSAERDTELEQLNAEWNSWLDR